MSLENDVSQDIIPLRANNYEIGFYREGTKEIIPNENVELLKIYAPLNLEVGEQYIKGVGFRNLGRIPDDANAILLEQEVRGNGSEFIAGVYCHLHSD